MLIPSALRATHEGVNKIRLSKDVYGWGSSTICNILEKREYLGHTISFKTRKHFKDKEKAIMSGGTDEIFENTHEPIVDQQTFDLAENPWDVRRYPDGWGEAAPSQACSAPIAAAKDVLRTNNGKRISPIYLFNTAKSQLKLSARHSTVSMKMWYCPCGNAESHCQYAA